LICDLSVVSNYKVQGEDRQNQKFKSIYEEGEEKALDRARYGSDADFCDNPET